MKAIRRHARSVWVLADCCRAGAGLSPEKRVRVQELQQGVGEAGNLILCTASSGDGASYESETFQHGLFTHAWIEAIQGRAPALLYEPVAHGRVLTLSGLQFAVARGVQRRVREAGVRQQVAFPRLEGSFAPSLPVFMPSTEAEPTP